MFKFAKDVLKKMNFGRGFHLEIDSSPDIVKNSKNDEIINNIFGSFTACNIYKYSGSGYILKRNTKEAVYGYFLNYANLEILNKSFFDEIRSKKAPLIAGNPRL